MSIEFDLLLSMKRIRWVEERIADEYPKGEMRCPVHLSIGQEGVAAAIGRACRRDDFMVSGHRAHAHYLGKGGDLRRMIAELYGKETGCSKGKGGSMHLTDPDAGFTGSTAIVANTIPVGVGLGLSIQLRKTDQVSLICFGDGAIEEGVFYESVNFAAVRKLPVLFLCENNFYSVYSPLSVRQPKERDICRMVHEMGVDSERVDGNDPLKVFSAVSERIGMLRKGSAPFFLEFPTYRWREHCGPHYDNQLGYRSEEEFIEWQKRDPLLALSGTFDPSEIQQVEARIRSEIDEAFDFGKASAFPAKADLHSHVFKESDV